MEGQIAFYLRTLKGDRWLVTEYEAEQSKDGTKAKTEIE
jgi:hypothetical protein